MNINKINLLKISLKILLILSISILIYNFQAYRIANKRLDTIIGEIKNENDLLQSKLMKAEKIAINRAEHPLDKEYNLIDIEKVHKTYWSDKYEKLINERNLLQNKLKILRSSNGWIIMLQAFKKDAITNRFYFGTKDYLASLIEKYRLFINSKEIKTNYKNEYKIYSPDSLDIVFQKISFNYDKNRIDTISRHRKIKSYLR